MNPMPRRPKLKCKARTWEASASILNGVRSLANSTLPLPANPEGIAAATIGIEIICGASTAEELVTLLENANPQEEDPEIETTATEETAEEADLEGEETDQDQDPDPEIEIEIDHQEDTGTTPENIEEDTTGIETIAEIEVEIGIETVIDREITTVEIEESQDPDDLGQGPIHVLQLHQDDRGDQEVEIQHLPKSLKILEETTVDERGIPLLIEMKRTAH